MAGGRLNVGSLGCFFFSLLSKFKCETLKFNVSDEGAGGGLDEGGSTLLLGPIFYVLQVPPSF